MKKSIVCLISLFLALSMILISCDGGGNGDDIYEGNGTEGMTNEDMTNNPGGDENETGDFVDESPYTVTESLMDGEISEMVYSALVNGDLSLKKAADMLREASYTMNHTESINDCKLLSMTLPILKTTTPDEEGNFILTLFVFDSNFDAFKKEAKRTYKIKINAEEYGLPSSKNMVKKTVKVDLSEYDITISATEALGFFAKTDTIYPAIILNKETNSDEALKTIQKEAPNLTGCYKQLGSSSVSACYDTLIVDFEWEKTYESKSQYLAMKNRTEYYSMVEALREKYSGKYLSIIGDSISSYNGFCNDTKANSTLGNNAVYYPTWSKNVSDSSLMYWGRLVEDIGMKPCVMNGWSGSSAYGRDGMHNMLERAVQLHRDNGTPNNTADDISPDVIIIYIGVNDASGGSPLDASLASALKKGTAKDAVGTWFESVLNVAKSVGGAEKGKTYANFDQVYALSINAMKEKYPNAEIFCLTLQENNHPRTPSATLKDYNVRISAIAEYFGATVVDQSTDIITKANCHAYTADNGELMSLHPTSMGHQVMAENIVKTMYEKLKD